MDEGTIIEVEAALPQKRIKKNKGMAGEIAQDEALSNEERAYAVNVHNIILDTATEAISRRFLTHGTLLADLAWLHPNNFTQIRTTLTGNTLENLSKYVLKFESSTEYCT